MNFFKLISKNGFNTNPWLPPEVQSIIEAYGVNRAYSIRIDMVINDMLLSQYYLTYGTRFDVYPMLPFRLFLHNKGKFFEIINIFSQEIAIIGRNFQPLYCGDNKTSIIDYNELIDIKKEWLLLLNNFGKNFDEFIDSSMYKDSCDNCLFLYHISNSNTGPIASWKFIFEFINQKYLNSFQERYGMDKDLYEQEVNAIMEEQKYLATIPILPKCLDKVNLSYNDSFKDFDRSTKNVKCETVVCPTCGLYAELNSAINMCYNNEEIRKRKEQEFLQICETQQRINNSKLLLIPILEPITDIESIDEWSPDKDRH